MIYLDPDNDLLEKMDRQEREAGILAWAKVVAGSLVVAGAVYEIVTRGFGGSAEIARDLAVLVFISAAIGFLRLFV